jgi:2-isopropylmalate synthase
VSTVELYDATLRDGMQGQGMTLSAHEKVRVAHRLDELGVHLIEAGFPSSNPKELELFELLASERFDHAQIAAFGMTRRRGVRADEDEGLRILASCFAPVCTVVGKTWALHLDKVVRVDRAENLAMIAESVAFLVAAGKRVVYDAEHFFDGFRDDADYAVQCLRAAADAGAETVCLCDTNGSSLPHQVASATRAVVDDLGDRVRIGFHGHNDAECGVANSLTAVDAGARQVQGTMNGVGERTGNANLVSIIANLQLKMGHDVVGPERLERLTEVAHFVDELLNLTPNPNQPYVGKNAFAHKGGLHVAGVRADASTFEHVEPEQVGNVRELLISELSGRGTAAEKAAAAGLSVDDAAASRIVERVKDLEHRGYHFEAADGSFELLMRRESGEYEPLFTLESWRVIVEKRASPPGEKGKVETEATIKIWIDGERYVRTAEGNGPVNALDAALRAAITEIHPHLRDIELVNYKVRILDESHGTGAVTRVLIDASDGQDVWGAIGVDENVIAASWQALVDSLEYPEQPGRRARRPASDEAGARSA